jgi:hypothetical protein
MVTQKYLYIMKNGEKFLHNGKIHTVYQTEGNMTEVFTEGRFWAWNNYDGKGSVKVTPYTQNI